MRVPHSYWHVPSEDVQREGLGKEYTIRTNVPLLQTFTADIPVDVMTADALAIMQERVKAVLPYVVVGAVALVGVTVAVVAAYVLGRRTR